jgi:hypothetical protein
MAEVKEIKNAFTNIEYIDPALQQQQPTAFGSQFEGLHELRIGAGSTSFSVDKSGWWMGANRFANAPAKCDMLGNASFNSILINGRDGSVIAAAIDANGNFVNQLLSSNFNTQTTLILGEFQFSGSGARKIATDDDNGVWISPTGILGKKAGATTFALDNGGNATFGGTLVAASGTFGTITAGTFTGVVVQTATSGRRMKINGSSNQLQWLNGDSVEGLIYNDGSGNMLIDADNAIYIVADGVGDTVNISSGADTNISSGDDINLMAQDGILLHMNTDGGAGTLSIGSAGVEKAYIDASGNLVTAGDIQCGDTFKSSDGTSGGNYTSYGFITSIRASGGQLQAKYREITVKDGLVTNISGETGWNDMGPY